jgi:isopenicillin-N epimerase
MRHHWTLDPEIVFLNHGAFGACPRPVLGAAARCREDIEREPVQFFSELLESGIDRARAAVGAFVGARPEDVAFVANSTTGVNAVLRSLDFGPGDAILTTDHAYGGCRNVLDFVARRTGAEVVTARIPVPIRDPAEIVERVMSAASPRVKLAMIDHVTSPTGIVFPIDAIVEGLRARGVETLVDGAHAPGMVPLDLRALGAGYYVGNFHKWVCSPKGAAMLWVREDLQARIHPTVISHGYASVRARSRFLEEFDWTGSDDPSAWLAVPEAIRFIGSLVPGGWAEVRARNAKLAREARRVLSEVLGGEPLAPESMLGSLAALRIPDGAAGGSSVPTDEPLHRLLLQKYRIEVPVFSWPAQPHRLLRVSAHLYNTIDEYEALARALSAELPLRG